jgi:hypothetical protein
MDSLLLEDSRGESFAVVSNDERQAACGYLTSGEDGLVDSPPTARSADPYRPGRVLRITTYTVVARHSFPCAGPPLPTPSGTLSNSNQAVRPSWSSPVIPQAAAR